MDAEQLRRELAREQAEHRATQERAQRMLDDYEAECCGHRVSRPEVVVSKPIATYAALVDIAVAIAFVWIVSVLVQPGGCS